jgi:adenosylhomocysteine nucleosidase
MREIAVFTALKVEMSPLKSAFSSTHRVSRSIPIHIGEIEGTKVILVCSGVGEDRSVEAAEFLLSKYCPTGVLSTGFCGGLVPGLIPGDVVIGSSVVRRSTRSGSDSKQFFLGNESLMLQRTLKRHGIRAQVGGFVTVSRPVFSKIEKNRLARETGAMVAEMETFHLGEVFLIRRIPFVAMRAVVDSLEDPLPEMDLSRGKVGWPEAFGVLRDLIFRKGSISNLGRLYKNGRRAQSSLARTVAALMKYWPEIGSWETG